MNRILAITARWVAGVCALALMVGCAGTQPMYGGWNDYQPQVYAYLKSQGELDPAEQIAKLETARQKMELEGKALPPGYRAHLGMLYAKAGQPDQSAENMAAEKASFPESTSFMDFLLRTFKGKAKP